MRIGHTPRDEQRMHVLELAHVRHPPAFRLDNEMHRRLDAQRRVVRVAGLLEQRVQHVSEGPLRLARVGVRLVGLEDHHPDFVR